MTDPHRARLFDMARNAGYRLVPVDEAASADAMSAAAIHEAIRCRGALRRIAELLATPDGHLAGTTSVAPLRAIVAEALDPSTVRAMDQRPPLDIVREVIIDHSPQP